MAALFRLSTPDGRLRLKSKNQAGKLKKDDRRVGETPSQGHDPTLRVSRVAMN